MNVTIEELLKKDIAYMGSDWEEDESVTDGNVPGHRYVGEKPFINCSDTFFWGCSDGEDITEKTLPLFNKALEDCNGDIEAAATLYCARMRKQRPQGAMYTYIDKELWPLFHECGEEREVGFGNPYAPGDYNRDDWE